MVSEDSTTYKAARRISDIGNAITFSLIVGILFSFVPEQSLSPWLIFLMAFLLMIFGPGFFLVLAMKVKKVDFDFTDRASRTPYYLVIEICYALGIMVFSPILLPSWSMFNISIVSVILNGGLLVINLKWKISAHAAGAAGPAVGFAIVFGWWTLIIMVPVVLAIIWSRLILKKHTPLQLLFGTLLAAFSYGVVLAFLYPLALF
jgi:membrane-associated phospholipid phosphatase